MNDLRQNLIREFQDADYRYAYAESFLNTKIATQIKTLREQRGKKQGELGALIGTKQSGFSRFEDVNHSVWKTDTLWDIARALDVRLNISFETFGSLLGEKENFNRESLKRPEFAKDPAFADLATAKAAATKRQRTYHNNRSRRRFTSHASSRQPIAPQMTKRQMLKYARNDGNTGSYWNAANTGNNELAGRLGAL